MPKVLRDFIKRATDLNQPPNTYAEAATSIGTPRASLRMNKPADPGNAAAGGGVHPRARQIDCGCSRPGGRGSAVCAGNESVPQCAYRTLA
jgi:hypothetical protein